MAVTSSVEVIPLIQIFWSKVEGWAVIAGATIAIAYVAVNVQPFKV